MWTTERSSWVLLNIGDSDGRPQRLIMNRMSKGVLIIEDDDVSQAVKDELLKHGCEVVDQEPLEN
jgi:hypothetical protein